MKRRGLSLMETMVAVFIMGIVVWGAYEIFREGIQYYRTNNRASNAQADCLNLLSKMSLQMSSAKDDLVRHYDTVGVVPGVVFATSLADDGRAHYDEPNGNKVFWQKLICFYLDTSTGKVYRKEQPLPNSGSMPGETGTSDTTTVDAQLASCTTSYFATLNTNRTTLVAQDIRTLKVSLYDPSTGMVPGAGGVGGPGGKQAFDIVVEAGNPTDIGPMGYFIKLNSRVAPRG
jgi:prepilin-type N-terminal cleavage/methylation domain-containing protein